MEEDDGVIRAKVVFNGPLNSISTFVAEINGDGYAAVRGGDGSGYGNARRGRGLDTEARERRVRVELVEFAGFHGGGRWL